MIQAFKNDKRREEVMASYNRIVAKFWPEGTEGELVPTRWGGTHCLLAGDRSKPPLFLFHGVGDNSAVMWALNIGELLKHYRCIAVDTIGGPGLSVPGERFKSGEFDQTEWISEVIDHYGGGKAHLAGVSNGAYMAYQYTVSRPDRVAAAVCLEGGMVVHPLRTMARTMAMMFPEILAPTDRNLLRILKKLSAPGSRVFDDHPLLAEHLVLLLKSHNRNAMFPHRIESYRREQGIALKDKLYFMIGSHYGAKQNSFMKLLQEGGYDFKVIPEAGHGINHEQPEAVNREIVRFLQAGS